MDLGGTAKTTTAASTVESTVVVEKSCSASEVTEKPAASGKNGSVPDSSADSLKDTACSVTDSPGKTKEPPIPSPKKASEDDVVIAEVTKSPAKQQAAATISTTSSATPCAEQMEDNEDDELLKRMEAIEKGVDLDAMKEATGHQNGMPEHRMEVSQDKQNVEKVTDTTLSAADTDKPSVASSEASSAVKQSSLKMEASDSAASELAVSKVQEVVGPSSKRKPAEGGDDPSSNESDVQKASVVTDVTDAPGSSDITSAKQVSELSAEPPGPSESAVVQKTTANDKPPSVEKMEVDGSPEPEASSSPQNVEPLPDTEPNTEEKSEEISSSVAEEEPMRQEDESAENSKTENSNVSSSDDKRECGGARVATETLKPADSEVSASALPTPSGDEAMEVDDDENDLAESSTSAGPAAPGPVPVVEPPCIKKVAYLCGEDEEPKQSSTDAKEDCVVSTEKSTACAAATATTSPVISSTLAASTSEALEPMEVVDSGAKASSSKPSILEPAEDVVDSSNVPTTVTEDVVVKSTDKPSESTRQPEESVVGSSQPSSSSDTKKPSATDNHLDEQRLREAVHRSGLLTAKATSTPNHSTTSGTGTPSSSNPATPTPKLLNPVTTSAVSSSNVYSSTPIHPSFGKVSSGNVSKITNPPSSVETSRIEVDDTTTTTTMTSSSSSTNNEQSAALSVESETLDDKKAGETKSLAKSLPSTTETATTGTSDSSAKSTITPKKELRHEDSNSSKASGKTASDISEVDSCTASAMNSTEEINLYVSNAGKVNGISSTSEGSDVDIKTNLTKSLVSMKREEDDSKVSVSSAQLDLSRAISPTTSVEQQYEVSVWYEGKELQFLSVERIHSVGGVRVTDPSVTVDASLSSKQSSTATTNGSVSSIGPFTLPANQTTVVANVGQSSDSSSSSVATVTGGAAKSSHSFTVPQMKQTVMGPKALCDLIIDEFRKLRRTFAPDDDDATEEEASTHGLLKSPKTPAVVGGRGRKDSAKKSVSRGQKRSKAADSDEEDDADVRTPRGSSATKQAAKRAKGSGVGASSSESPVAGPSSTTPKSKSVHQEPKQFDICCLARWTDRKYYAGRVTNYREDNKYVVVFEDGCSKTLSRDIIVFGEDGVLPIKHHSIHALTGGDTYEPAIVEEIKRNDANEIVYGVRTASSTLEVTATDIYLTDEQAKWIHNACKDKPDPIQKLLQAGSDGSVAGEDGTGGPAGSTLEGGAPATELAAEMGDKGARSTRSKRGANDKSMTPATPEAGYSGGVGKKGRRGRRIDHQQQQQQQL
uniref:Tudor domain-containing protein n=1 Tax=Anopheles epiroticus TaxID=199890 RepID=A0A182PH18_9DIPT